MVLAITACAVARRCVSGPHDAASRAAQPHPGGGALRRPRRRRSSRRPSRSTGRTQNHPGPVPVLPPADLRRVERLDDGQRLARSGLARRLPAARRAQTSTDGDCDTPAAARRHAQGAPQPVRDAGRAARPSSTSAPATRRVSRPGSLLDGFCSRCHMPTNYVDNVPLHNVTRDAVTGLEHGRSSIRTSTPRPTTAPASPSRRSTPSCATPTRARAASSAPSATAIAETPRHAVSTTSHDGARRGVRARRWARSRARSWCCPAPAGHLRRPDPRAAQPRLRDRRRRLPPVAARDRRCPSGSGRCSPRSRRPAPDANTSGVFKQRDPLPSRWTSSKHDGYRQRAVRARRDVQRLPRRDQPAAPSRTSWASWVGGFPIERTYTEWVGSRYADRPGNANFDPRFKRDCQTCHMQQDYGQPGTAQTPVPRRRAAAAPDASRSRPTAAAAVLHATTSSAATRYVPRLIGGTSTRRGTVAPYPELSIFSFSSADENSPYRNAYWTDVDRKGAPAQQARLAWDRLRNVLDLDALRARERRAPAATRRSRSRVTNTGSGHKFPTGFPEGRIAWLAVHAFDLATGTELAIHDSLLEPHLARRRPPDRRSDDDRSQLPGCDWKLPAGSPDPYAIQFKAVASLGDGCPTLDLAYAAPLEPGHQRARAAHRRRRARSSTRSNPLGPAAVPRPQRQRRPLRRLVPARHAAASRCRTRAPPRTSTAMRS